MSECYLVRYATATGRAMAGIYVALQTAIGMVATWKQKRAASYESEMDAANAARRLTSKLSDTSWELHHVT